MYFSVQNYARPTLVRMTIPLDFQYCELVIRPIEDKSALDHR